MSFRWNAFAHAVDRIVWDDTNLHVFLCTCFYTPQCLACFAHSPINPKPKNMNYVQNSSIISYHNCFGIQLILCVYVLHADPLFVCFARSLPCVGKCQGLNSYSVFQLTLQFRILIFSNGGTIMCAICKASIGIFLLV